MLAQTHTVQAGDTVSAIARRYGVPVSSVTGYRSGDANRIGVGERLTIGSAPMPPVNSINAQNLNQQPYAVPPAATRTGYYGLSGLIKNTQDSLAAYTAQAEKDAPEIKGVYDTLGGQAKKKAELYESEGVNAAKKEFEDFKRRMQAKEQAYIARVDRIRSNNPDGALAAGQDIELDRVAKNHAIESSADAITAEFKLGNYTNAKAIVDTMVDAETEDLKIKLEGLKYFAEKNDDKLNEAQKTLLAQRTAEVENEMNELKDLRTNIGEIQLKVAAAGGSADLIAKIGKSQDLTSAISLAAPTLGADGSGSGTFTSTQINSGAAKAGVDISTFKGFDADTKNFFINGDIDGAKKSIDSAFLDEEASLEEVTAEINAMNLPKAGADMLLQYAEKSRKENNPSPEEYVQKLLTANMSRDEATTDVTNWFSYEGKVTIPKAKKKEIADAITKVYGRTFWQKILPGGR